MAKNVWLKKFLLGLAGKPILKNLEKASKDCRGSQEKVLMDVLNWARDTEFGKKYNFAGITTPEQFREDVPVSSYDDLKPYIDRHSQGETDVLFPGKPLFYAVTSGTTKSPKLIPITKKYKTECYSNYSKMWLYSCLKDNPTIFDGYDLCIVSKTIEGYTKDGTSFGSLSGHAYETIPGFMKDIHVVPYSVVCLDDYEAKYYCIVRYCAEVPISYVITVNPSSLIQIVRMLSERAEEIIADIENGTISANLKVPDSFRKEEQAKLKPNPKRAAELREIYNRTGGLLPKDIWPELPLVNVWKCGNSGLYLKHLEGAFAPGTSLREFAYQASECRGGIVLHNDHMSSVMLCNLMYFEFIAEHDMEKENPRVYGAWELEDKKRYNILVTASNGLYRYDMNDILEVNGFYNEFPRLRFIQKGAGVTNLTGEKLYERQVIDAVREAESSLDMAANFFIAFADMGNLDYTLFVEFAGDHSNDQIKQFNNTVDENLGTYNMEFKSRRDSGRLAQINIAELVPDSFEHFKAECLKMGAREGQFKLVHLMKDQSRLAIFKNLVKTA